MKINGKVVEDIAELNRLLKSEYESVEQAERVLGKEVRMQVLTESQIPRRKLSPVQVAAMLAMLGVVPPGEPR